MPKIYRNFPSHLLSAFVYLERQNCLSTLYTILIDQKAALEKQRQQTKVGSREGTCLLGGKGGGRA